MHYGQSIIGERLCHKLLKIDKSLNLLYLPLVGEGTIFTSLCRYIIDKQSHFWHIMETRTVGELLCEKLLKMDQK